MSMNFLPHELVEIVLTYCEVPSLLALRVLNRAFHEITMIALARVVDTAGPAFPNNADPDDHHLPPKLIRALLNGNYAEHVRGLVVREIARKSDDICKFSHYQGLPGGYAEADEFLLQHRRLSLISHPDNIVGKLGRQIDAYRPMHPDTRCEMCPSDLEMLPNLTKLCILNNNTSLMPRFLSPTVLERLTWLEIEVDGVRTVLKQADLDAITTHCKQMTHLRIVSAVFNVPKEYWISFLRRMHTNTFKVLDIIVYPHVNTDVWEEIIKTQGWSLQAITFFETERMLSYLADMPTLPNVQHLLTSPLDGKLEEYQPLLTERLPNLRHIQLASNLTCETKLLNELPTIQSSVQRGRYAEMDDAYLSIHDFIPTMGCGLHTVHIVYMGYMVRYAVSELLKCPSLRVLSITESLEVEGTEDNPNDFLTSALTEVDDQIRRTSSLRVLRALFWTAPVEIETARSVLKALPRLGSLQLPRDHTPQDTVDMLRDEFGHNRIGLESMDFGEIDPKHGVIALNTSEDYYCSSGEPQWYDSNDDPVLDWGNDPGCGPWCSDCGPCYGYYTHREWP